MKNTFRHYTQWYQHAEGNYVLAQIDTYLEARLQAIFGYYALELGILAGQHDFLAQSRVTDRYRLAAHYPPNIANNAQHSANLTTPALVTTLSDPTPESQLKPNLHNHPDTNDSANGANGAQATHTSSMSSTSISSSSSMSSSLNHFSPLDICAETEYLPIMADNIDLIFASHVLECSNKPHQVLREIDRVLVPEGHCFLLGFNPMSFAGLQQRFLRQMAHKNGAKHPSTHPSTHNYRLHPAHQTKDWLKLLGFNILAIKHFAYRPAIAQQPQPTWLASIWRSLAWMESIGANYLPALGSVYLIHAQKQVMARLPPAKKSRLRVLPETKPVIAISKGCNHHSSQKSS